MPNLDVIRNLTLRATATGFAEATAAADKLANAQGRVATSAGTMATVTDMSSRRTLSAAQALERLAAKHDEAYRAQQQHERGMALLERATAQGLAGTREFAIAQAALSKAHHEGAEAVGLNRMQMMEATHVAKAFFDEIMAGQSPLRALQVEGGRIAQIFAEGQGGVGGTLKALAGYAVRATTGWVGLSVGIGGAALIAGAAALSYVNAHERMQRALEGTGRAAGLTVAQLDAVAKAGARQANISVPEARSIAGDMIQAGLSGPQTQALVGTTARFARFTGQENGEAGRSLAEAFKDPVQGAAVLDKSLGFLNDRLSQTIRDLEESGQHQRAQIALQEAYEAALKATTDSTWAASEAMKEIKRWGGSLFDRAGALLTGGDRSPEDRLKFYEAQLPRTFDSPLAVGNLSRTYVQAQIDALRRQIETRADPAGQARDAEANRLSLQVGPLVRQIMPEIARATKAETETGLLRQALSDPGVLSRLGGGVARGDVETALRRTAVVSANADPMRRMMQDYDLAKASADAFSLAERAAVDARRAELAVLRETGDVSRAAVAAEIARNEAIAKANEEARQALEMSRQNAAMVGMTPYERGRQEIVNRYEGFGGLIDKASATRAELNDAMKPVADDLHRAGETIAEAMREAAKAIAGATSPYGALSPFKPNDAVGPFQPAPFAGKAGGVSDHERQAVEMLVAAGYNRSGSVGFVGGLSGESGVGLDPLARNASNHRGVAQFDEGRYAALSRFGDPTDFLTQIRFIIHELATSERTAGAALKGANTVEGGLNANFLYERPSQAEMASSYGQRLANGRALGADLIRSGHTGGQAFVLPTLTVRPANNNALGAPSPLAGVAPISATGAAAYRKAEGVDLAAYDKEHLIAPLIEAKNALDQQRGALDAQAASFGTSAGRAAQLSKQQELLTTYTRDHIAITADTRAGIDLLSKAYGDLAQAQQDAQQHQRDLTAALDDFRDTSKGALSSFVGDMLNGKSATEGLRDALKSIEGKIAGKLEDTAIDSLFGKSGSFGNAGAGGGGLFGGGLSSLLGGGSQAATAATSFFPAFASGGYTGPGTKYQAAGIVHAGEFVIQAQHVPANMNLLHAINTTGRVPGYADGGLVGGMPVNSGGGGDAPVGGLTVVHNWPGGVGDAHIESIAERGTMRALTSYDRALPGRMADRQKRTG